MIGTAAYLTGIAVLGLAIGTLLRATAAAISTLVALVLLLPGLGALLLPASWKDNVLQYLPTNAGSSFTDVQTNAGQLSTGAGAAVFAAWVLIPLTLCRHGAETTHRLTPSLGATAPDGRQAHTDHQPRGPAVGAGVIGRQGPLAMETIHGS